MKKWILLFLILCLPCWAGTWYVDSAAAGSETGVDWTNAWTTGVQLFAAMNTAVCTATSATYTAGTTTITKATTFGSVTTNMKVAIYAGTDVTPGWYSISSVPDSSTIILASSAGVSNANDVSCKVYKVTGGDTVNFKSGNYAMNIQNYAYPNAACPRVAGNYITFQVTAGQTVVFDHFLMGDDATRYTNIKVLGESAVNPVTFRGRFDSQSSISYVESTGVFTKAGAYVNAISTPASSMYFYVTSGTNMNAGTWHVITARSDDTITIDQDTFTDLETNGATLTQMKSAAYTFSSTDVSRKIRITGGTHATPGLYTITATSGSSPNDYATVDSAWATEDNSDHDDGAGEIRAGTDDSSDVVGYVFSPYAISARAGSYGYFQYFVVDLDNFISTPNVTGIYSASNGFDYMTLLDGTIRSCWRGALVSTGCTNWTFDGCALTDNREDFIGVGTTGIADLTIQDCTFLPHNIDAAQAGRDKIMFSGTNDLTRCTVQRNVFQKSDNALDDSQVMSVYNTAATANTDLLFQNNLVYGGTTSAYAILLECTTSDDSGGVQLIHNTLVCPYSLRLAQSHSSTYNLDTVVWKMYGNLIYDYIQDNDDYQGGSSGDECWVRNHDYNFFDTWDNRGADESHTHPFALNTHDVDKTDPEFQALFTTWGSDYTLPVGSAAIGAASATYAPADDRLGTSRPQPASGADDIGCYETVVASQKYFFGLK
jgi:hypothetical protein